MNKNRFSKIYIFGIIIYFFCLSGFASDLEKILQNIESNSIIQRKAARNALTKFLENAKEEERVKAEQKLLEKLLSPTSSRNLKIGIGVGLGNMREAFWRVEDQKKMEMQLYKAFKDEQNPTLKDRLEETLMTAKGLYRDAINDYNNDRVEQPEQVAEKFQRVFEHYPSSSYAPKAHYFLGKYYARVYWIQKLKGLNPDLVSWISDYSNKEFKELIKKIKDKIYAREYYEDARYYLALNYVLINQFVKAKKELRGLISISNPGDTITIYQFYYSGNKKDVVDTYFGAAGLAEYTLKYLEKNPNHTPDYIQKFIEYLKKFK
jgi:hypothetical protein